MISFDEAVGLVAGAASPLGTETVTLDAADGRIVAQPVVAHVASPRRDVSSMDGYAVVTAEIGDTLRVAGTSWPGAGHSNAIVRGEAVRIFTGAPLPPGAERIVIQEHVRREGDHIRIEELGRDTFIRRAGSDFTLGEVLIDAGRQLDPRALLTAAAADLAQLSVFRRPRLRVIATGDELVDPGRARAGAETIPESVSYGVASLARRWGAETLGRILLGDDLAAMRRQAASALEGVDLAVVTGGASVGDRDFARAMFGDGLELIFSRVRMKPGKPVWLGRVGGTLILGLPGNPTSAMVTARLFLAPLIAGMTGRDPMSALDWARRPLAEPVGCAGDRETFSRARLDDAEVRLVGNQDSGAQRALVQADLLVRRPPGDQGYAAGEPVDTLRF